MMERKNTWLMSEKIEWSIRVSIFRNMIILKQMGIAIGIPFGLLIVVLLFTTKANIYSLYAIGLLAALFLFTYLIIRILWGGKYHVAFVIDGKGVRCYTQKGQAQKNYLLNVLTVVLGALSQKPAVVGAGLLAQSRQDILIKWKNIRKVRYYPGQKVITIKGGFTENIAVFCTKENYQEIEEYVKFHL